MDKQKRLLTRKYSHRGYVVNRVFPACLEIFSRVVLFIIFWYGEGEKAIPCIRTIRPEELWLYKYPRKDSYVPSWALWLEVATIGPFLFMLMYAITKDKKDLWTAFMSYTLACLLNGAIVNTVKLCAGRPRPDFYQRCYPGGIDGDWPDDDKTCTGLHADVIEGRKSFPSGHSSWSFTVMVWAFQYISGKLETFSLNGDGKGWKLTLSVAPLLAATAIAISRTCDNHHHWQDVLVGSLLGVIVSYTVYRRYYPSISHRHCSMSLDQLTRAHSLQAQQQYNDSDEDVKVV